MVGKLPFTALTAGVTGEEGEPPHLVSVITGFHRRKEGMKQPNTAERREGEGWRRAGQEEPAAEDAAPPRPAPTLHPPLLTWGLSVSFSLCFRSSQNSLSGFPQQRQAGHHKEIKALEASTFWWQATCVLLQRRPLRCYV